MARDKWRDYVLSVTDGDPGIRIHQKTGIDQGTISRWINPGQRRAGVTAESARKFATAYDRHIIEVLVHAGVLTEEEGKIRIDPPQALDDIPLAALVAQIRRLTLELSRRIAESESPLR